jgi:ribosomal protein S27E
MASQAILKELKCPNCGTPLSQYNPSAQTVVCHNCGSYVAVGMGDPTIAGKTRKLPKSPVPVKLGERFTVDGQSYLVLGRVMYQGWDDEDSWRWNEWMLGAENGQMLWLSYDEKGFGLFTKKRFREQFDPRSSSVLRIGDLSVPIRERYPAKILGAEGELTWRAQENEQLYMAEGARNGKRYSIQKTDEELEIYEGRGVSEKAIAESFGDQEWLTRITRREQAAGNRKTIGGLCLLFAVASVALAIMFSGMGERVQEMSIPLTVEGASVPVTFDRAGRPAAVEMQLRDSLPENTTVDIDVSIISPDNTESDLFSQSFWHETGVDEDGFWRETDYRGTGIFVPLSNGEHRLRINVDTTTYNGPALTANVSIKRNIVVVQWFFGYAIVIGIIGVLFYMSVPSKRVV